MRWRIKIVKKKRKYYRFIEELFCKIDFQFVKKKYWRILLMKRSVFLLLKNFFNNIFFFVTYIFSYIF